MNQGSFFEETWVIMQGGGWLMVPLFLLAVLIYFSIFETFLYLKRHNYFQTDENEWAHWVEYPKDATGEIGEIIHYSQEGGSSPFKIRARFDELKEEHIPRLQRRIQFSTILVGVAPLTGLLGTVMGMLSTFAGLGVSAGDTLEMVAGGIQQALITTQAGLVIAIPGYIMMYSLRKHVTELELFFIRLELLTLQKFERQHNPERVAV